MPSSPDHEVPACAVPQAAQQHGGHQVRVGPGAAAPVAAEWNVQIVAQPARKRYVPAPPELGDAARQVRASKILREVEAEKQRQTDRHIGVSRKIEVDLNRKGGDSAPCGEPSGTGAGILKIRIGEARELVRDGQLLQQAEDGQQHAAQLLFAGRASSKGRGRNRGAHDRARPPVAGRRRWYSA